MEVPKQEMNVDINTDKTVVNDVLMEVQTVVSKKSKSEIQRELLALKRKTLALRRQGNLDEAEEILKSTKDLEDQLAEMEVPKQEMNSNIGAFFVDAKPQVRRKTSQTSVQQQILAHKKKALILKREGRIAEAKEELKQAKLLEKESIGVDNKNPDSIRLIEPRFRSTSTIEQYLNLFRSHKRNEQQSLSHKRQALKLRREGRTDEADAEFELAKNLESQLEAATDKPAGPVDDVGVEALLDPQLLSALRELGIESAVAQSPPEKTEPVRAKPVVIQAEPDKGKVVINKTDTTNKDRTELEEQIKAEKVKAVHLKRAGKQAEALDALRRAKLLEKKLNT
ncbi:tetratricopeptide-like helical domain containing protein [Tanacetum coccineum]|uniref:Tetratricopeptide-like helical domain containing protein n=1 Tax=Tanacetum coccineum TaxID=301880 RepID=A0ABQ5H8D4_9ASTR